MVASKNPAVRIGEAGAEIDIRFSVPEGTGVLCRHCVAVADGHQLPEQYDLPVNLPPRQYSDCQYSGGIFQSARAYDPVWSRE